MTEDASGESPILADGDRDVWVVESNPGSGWRIEAVLPSFEAAERFEDDFREWRREMNDNIPDEFEHSVRTRHGGRKSPTKMFESYPPEQAQNSE